MKVFEAPTPRSSTDDICVFLGGGISDCPDWQQDVIRMIDRCLTPRISNITRLYNPRRTEFDINDPNQSEVQIKWEFEHLKAADIVLFWFPKETLCPITLLELGKQMMIDQNLCVGCHPEYARKFDVEFQLKLECPGVKVVDSLEDLVDSVVEAIYDALNQRLNRIPLEPLSYA